MLSGYGLQFQAFFAALPISTGPGTSYRIDFFRKGYSGAVTDIRCGGTPWREETPEVLIGVKAKKISIGLILQDTTTLADFYTDGERDVIVTLSIVSGNTSNLLFQGYMSPYGASEPYQAAPYDIELTATCGLGALVDFPLFQYPLTLAYSGTLSVHELLKACLKWTGYELSLRSWTGRYEESVLTGGTTIPSGTVDPQRAQYLDTRIWLNDDGSYADCKQVLDDLCEAFRAVLVQHYGRWYFVSYDTITNPSAQPFYDYATFQGGLQPAVVTENILYQSGASADMRWLRPASIGFRAAKKKLTLRFDYGNPKNLLTNGGFTSGLNGWTVQQLTGKAVEINGDGSENNPFRVLINGQSIVGDKFVPGSYSLQQDVPLTRGTFPIGSRSREGVQRFQTEVHTLNLTGLFVNLVTAGAKITLSVRIGSSTWYLQKDGSWLGNTGGLIRTMFFENTWPVQGVQTPKPTTGQRFTVESEPVPGQGNYVVRLELFAGETLQPSPATGFRSITYRDLRLSLSNGSDIPIKGERWEIVAATADPKDRRRAEEITLVMGDQLSVTTSTYQAARYGAIQKSGGEPTRKWLLGGRFDRFMKLTGWQWLRWNALPLRYAQGDVMHMSPVRPEPPPFGVVTIPDLATAFEGVPTRWGWEPKLRKTTLTLHEKPGVNALTGETYKGSYETPDGVLVPIVEPTDLSAPVPVPGNPAPRQPVGGTITPARPGKDLSGFANLANLFSLLAIPKPNP